MIKRYCYILNGRFVVTIWVSNMEFRVSVLANLLPSALGAESAKVLQQAMSMNVAEISADVDI